MKLYSLSLRAIGPFPGEHRVDFSALGRSGLFLLEGPTGAGKSTVIDAVVFALYGHLAGLGASKQRLYSHHAEVGVEPYVDLVFEVEAGVFRIRRTPAFERPKKRGTGTRTINESVVLTRLPDVDDPEHGLVVSTRAQEVGDEITRLVGLRRDQFLQTVVLPQGEFATFLRATGEERKSLLETIFRTDVYERLTAELVERRRVAQRASADADQRVESARDVLAKVADVDPDRLDDPAAFVADVERQRDEAAQVAAAARSALDEAEHAVRRAEDLAARLARRADLLRRRAVLEADRDAAAQGAARLATARRAAQVMPLVRAERAALEAHVIAAADHTAAAERSEPGLRPQHAPQHLEALAERLRDVDAAQRVEAELPRAREEFAALAERVDDLTESVADLDRRAAARPQRRGALLTEARQLDAELQGRSRLELAVTEAEQRREAALRVVDLQRDLAQARAEVKQLAGDATTAIHVVKELQLARIQGMAGELAEALVVGEACVVCGSDAHPSPAQRSADHPEPDAIEQAERRRGDLDRALNEARAALDVATQQEAFWRDRSGGLTTEAAEAAFVGATADLAALDEVASRRAATAAALDDLDSEAARDTEARSALVADLATATERRERAADRVRSDEQRVAATLDGQAADLSSLRAALVSSRDKIERFVETARALEIATQRLDTTRVDLVEALTAHEFTDADDVRAHALGAAELERLQHEVDAHRQESALVADGLADPAIASLTGDEAPDLAEVADRRAASADAHEAAVALATVAQRRHDQVASATAELSAAQRAASEAAQEAATVVRLAGLADGSSPQNLKKLTLGTYVLLRRFDQVVHAANARLGPMSEGRYHLRVSDERERTGSGRRTGLSLSVIDAETGREREPRTLSGGETFYVSLCLALGLADVVTAESGGTQLATLFVDEGFGSLDPQTLDAVMAQLSSLARGGRTVGLVSHVEELKQRVADRISVRRHRDGSSTLRVVA